MIGDKTPYTDRDFQGHEACEEMHAKQFIKYAQAHENNVKSWLTSRHESNITAALKCQIIADTFRQAAHYLRAARINRIESNYD